MAALAAALSDASRMKILCALLEQMMGITFQASHTVRATVPKSLRKACCPCLDWSERQFHLGGQAGAALLRFFEQQRWIERVIGYREVTITAKGNHALKTHFHVESR